jgi:hypothetical protein
MSFPIPSCFSQFPSPRSTRVPSSYKLTEAGVIPAGWDAKSLGAFVSLQRGHDLTWRDRRKGHVPVMGSAGQNGFHDTAITCSTSAVWGPTSDVTALPGPLCGGCFVRGLASGAGRAAAGCEEGGVGWFDSQDAVGQQERTIPVKLQLFLDFFADLSRQQAPQYFWIGCSDRRMFNAGPRGFRLSLIHLFPSGYEDRRVAPSASSATRNPPPAGGEKETPDDRWAAVGTQLARPAAFG